MSLLILYVVDLNFNDISWKKIALMGPKKGNRYDLFSGMQS